MTLRELRVNAGLRQADVAKKLDVDQAAVSHWDNGKSRPTRKYIKKLAKLYGVTDEQLLAVISGGAENAKSENIGAEE